MPCAFWSALSSLLGYGAVTLMLACGRQVPELKHKVYCEVATLFAPLICTHTDTPEPLTAQQIAPDSSSWRPFAPAS